ncbi:protein of unknown function [Kyrpidia spormannii]|uniref:Uncharacterized protein n=1 Tax=Kyrpidia spormannii TaxID=2055160 RepID=A0ACA8ZCS3_9BACL|nr:protein of unknown function [Kyrpidia spormannii]
MPMRNGNRGIHLNHPPLTLRVRSVPMRNGNLREYVAKAAELKSVRSVPMRNGNSKYGILSTEMVTAFVACL